MRLYDDIRLNEEIAELAQKGIHKEYHGLIVGIDGDIFTVCFFNPYNHGEIAYVKVDKKYLRYSSRSPDHIIREMEGFFPNVDMEKHTCLTECDVKEYDVVELLVEKDEYAIEGVHKGTYGTVLFPYAIENKWGILFFNVGDDQREVEICVDREDFIVVE